MAYQLVIIPGFMGQAADFNHLVEALPSHYQCHVFLPPEKIDASLDFDVNIEAWYKQIKRDLPKKYILYGYSLGGRIAMGLASKILKGKHGVLQGLLLESANPGLASQQLRDDRIDNDESWAQRFESTCNEAQLKKLLQQWYQQPVFNSLSAEQVDKLIASKLSLDSDILAQQLRAFSLGKQPNYRTHLLQINTPMVYFSGKRDRKFSEIGKNMIGAKHVVCASSGHNIHFEQPLWLAKQIQKYFY